MFLTSVYLVVILVDDVPNIRWKVVKIEKVQVPATQSRTAYQEDEEDEETISWRRENLYIEMDHWRADGITRIISSSTRPISSLLDYLWVGDGRILLSGAGTTYMELLHAMEPIIAAQAGHFWTKSLQSIGMSLDVIDNSICSDVKTRAMVDQWRYLFGVWRSNFPQINAEIEATIETVGALSDSSPAKKRELDNINAVYSRLLKTSAGLQLRNGESFQAVMSTLSIMESKAAIGQGHKIQKLTELAFVFIPLSFTASVFGMEVKVQDILNTSLCFSLLWCSSSYFFFFYMFTKL